MGRAHGLGETGRLRIGPEPLRDEARDAERLAVALVPAEQVFLDAVPVLRVGGDLHERPGDALGRHRVRGRAVGAEFALAAVPREGDPEDRAIEG